MGGSALKTKRRSAVSPRHDACSSTSINAGRGAESDQTAQADKASRATGSSPADETVTKRATRRTARSSARSVAYKRARRDRARPVRVEGLRRAAGRRSVREQLPQQGGRAGRALRTVGPTVVGQRRQALAFGSKYGLEVTAPLK